MKNVLLTALTLLAFSISATFGQATKKTDAEIKHLIIKESIAAYSGSCPCPESQDRAGKRCGARSAYSKAGGKSVLCYEIDVTPKMVDEYRK